MRAHENDPNFMPSDAPPPGGSGVSLGWWAISGDALLTALKQANEGADPDILYAELYANSDTRTP